MTDTRPSPEILLKKIKREERKEERGKLKIFFGYAAGVGKTYAMLEAAQRAKEEGIDVVAGYIEAHLRPETNKLLAGLPMLPTLLVDRKGIIQKEFDLDAALLRHPKLILVDELAHTNAPGLRNLKRYQDIDELLYAGIDVYTTVNVQHIESLNDMVYQITNITVKERIPDKVFDKADKVELVDVEPEDLIERLISGKVYKNTQAKRALENFFTKENLSALREIALRRTADQLGKRLDEEYTSCKREYYTKEHILICLSASPSNSKVIRTAARMVDAFHGKFTALFVETSQSTNLSEENAARLRINLKLAEQLGATIVTVYGENVAEQIAAYAKVAEVSKIVIGRSNNKKRFWSKPTFIEQLTQLAPVIDIYIIPDNLKPYRKKGTYDLKGMPKITLKDTLISLGIFVITSIIGLVFHALHFNEANMIMMYILGVLVTAIFTYGKIYSGVLSVLSVVAFNYLFTEPRFTFNINDVSYTVTFIIMFVVAFFSSSLATRVKNQVTENALKAKNIQALLETSQMLQKARDIEEIYTVMGKQIIKLLDSTVMIYPVLADKVLGRPVIYPIKEEDTASYLTKEEYAVAQWVQKNNKNAGATTNTLSAAKCFYMAVRGSKDVFAVVGIVIEDNKLEVYKKNLLIAMLGEYGLSIEKERINERKKEVHARAKQEQLRANLLRAISHDLRSPLTSISGNANILMKNSSVLNEEKKNGLYTDIYDDALWLINLVENLLSVTRMDNTKMELRMQPELLEDIIAEALRHTNRRANEYHIKTAVLEELLMARMDAGLVIQVIVNLLNNAIKYTPSGSTIDITAKAYEKDKVLVAISDDGAGINQQDKEKLFDLFFTNPQNNGDSRRGLGLGLSLCKSIVTAHGGEIWVRDNIPKGTVFEFTLKREEVGLLE